MNPEISVIITHHLPENRPYLDLCLQSVFKSLGVNFEVILVSDCVVDELPYQPNLKTYMNVELNTATKKVHAAMANLLHPESKYILLLSDDVMISNHLLWDQVQVLRERECILNPFSNSELGSRFITKFAVLSDYGDPHFLYLKPDMCIEDIKDYEQSIMIAVLGFPQFLTKEQWVPFYCTMMRHETWNKIGLLDEQLELRHNDEDYCYRAAGMGIPSYINLEAFAFHFGSRTIGRDSSSEKNAATEYFLKKWSI